MHAGDSLIRLSADFKAAALTSCMAAANIVSAFSPLNKPNASSALERARPPAIAQGTDGESPGTTEKTAIQKTCHAH